jgi:hypothetical protein
MRVQPRDVATLRDIAARDRRVSVSLVVEMLGRGDLFGELDDEVPRWLC